MLFQFTMLRSCILSVVCLQKRQKHTIKQSEKKRDQCQKKIHSNKYIVQSPSRSAGALRCKENVVSEIITANRTNFLSITMNTVRGQTDVLPSQVQICEKKGFSGPISFSFWSHNMLPRGTFPL